MIVISRSDGWQVIYHRAHALLAAEIAGHWRKEYRPERWVETLAAIISHDDMEREWESVDHLTDAGTPQDFRLPGAPMTMEGLEEVSTKSQYRSRWVALMNSMHQLFLNEPQKGQNPALDAYMENQLNLQRKWRRELAINRTEAEKAYALFQWCDRLSLIFCMDELPSRARWLEISEGPDKIRYDIRQRDDGSVEVTPWPFDSREFTLTVESSILKQARFKDNDEFLTALRTAEVKPLRWLLSEKPPREPLEAEFTPKN